VVDGNAELLDALPLLDACEVADLGDRDGHGSVSTASNGAHGRERPMPRDASVRRGPGGGALVEGREHRLERPVRDAARQRADDAVSELCGTEVVGPQQFAMMASSFDISHSERMPTPTHACITLGSEMRRTNPRATLK